MLATNLLLLLLIEEPRDPIIVVDKAKELGSFRRVDNTKRWVHMFEIHMLEAIYISIIDLNEPTTYNHYYFSPSLRIFFTLFPFFFKKIQRNRILISWPESSLKKNESVKKKIDLYTYSHWYFTNKVWETHIHFFDFNRPCVKTLSYIKRKMETGPFYSGQ